MFDLLTISLVGRTDSRTPRVVESCGGLKKTIANANPFAYADRRSFVNGGFSSSSLVRVFNPKQC
jgi:hypothetical protein